MTRRLLLIVLVLITFACRGERRTVDENVLVASAKLTNAWIRNFNPFSVNALWPTTAGIYEPLMIYNTLTGKFVPWLATKYSWSADKLSVEFEIRQGVKWSDGRPLTAEDVLFTFELTKTDPALDTGAIWKRLESVELVDATRVRFRLKTVDVPALAFLAHQMIVPKHIWHTVSEPSKITNDVPIGSGPYTEVLTFRTQLYELGRNPYYWNRNARLANKLRMPAYSANDTVSLALASGDIDWAGHNMPLIEKTYVARDPEHFKYWFPPLGGMIFLYANTEKPPLNDVRIRQAISASIDRNKLVEVGMSGYTKPADGSGLSPTYSHWKCCKNEAESITRYDLDKARKLLNSADCVETSSGWQCGEHRLKFTLQVVNGWSDWVRSVGLIKQDLAQIGIPVEVKSLDFGLWFERLQKGDYDLSIGWSNEGPSPYEFYQNLASSETRKPSGIASNTNWHRYADDVFDSLLSTFPSELDIDEQRRIVNQMQRQFIKTTPAIPLFPNPSWGTYSTRFFTGFPNAENPYAKLTPHADPERLILLTSIKPRGTAP